MALLDMGGIMAVEQAEGRGLRRILGRGLSEIMGEDKIMEVGRTMEEDMGESRTMGAERIIGAEPHGTIVRNEVMTAIGVDKTTEAGKIMAQERLDSRG